MKSKVITICGNSRTGKTTLAKKFGKMSVYVDLVDKNKLKDSVKDLTNLKFRSNFIVNKLKYLDNTITELQVIGDYVYLKHIGSDNLIPLHNESHRVQYFLYIISLIRSKENLIVDNFDLIYIGSGYKHLVKFILSEIFFAKNQVVFVFTDLCQYQLVSLYVAKNMEKEFYLTKYDYKSNSYEHMELNYNHMLYIISKYYNNSHREGFKNISDIELAPMDMVSY